LLRRNEEQTHLLTCPATVLPCDICQIDFTRESLPSHMNDKIQHHMTIMMSSIRSISKENKDLRHQLSKAVKPVVKVEPGSDSSSKSVPHVPISPPSPSPPSGELGFWFDMNTSPGSVQHSCIIELVGLSWQLSAQLSYLPNKKLTMWVSLPSLLSSQVPLEIDLNWTIGHGSSSVRPKGSIRFHTPSNGINNEAMKQGISLELYEIFSLQTSYQKLWIGCRFNLLPYH
jgi:hypothetical protein